MGIKITKVETVPIQDDLPPGIDCKNCGDREASVKWTGDGGVLALVHGAWQPWCSICVLKTQIEHAEERAAALPELRRELEEALDEDRCDTLSTGAIARLRCVKRAGHDDVHEYGLDEIIERAR